MKDPYSQPNFTTIYNKTKTYPTYKKLTIYKTPLYVPIENTSHSDIKNSIPNPEQLKRSIQRSKTNIKDIINCNDFNLFCTFTFKDNRNDIDLCKTRMTNWLNSQQKLHGKFQYLVVPEFHKDGKALHFHALFNNYTGNLEPKINKKTLQPLTIKGHKLLKITSWQNGHSDASEIQDKLKTASYVTKYITKDMPTFHSKNRYFASQNLYRPEKAYNVDPSEYHNHPDAQRYEYDEVTVIIVPNSEAKLFHLQSIFGQLERVSVPPDLFPDLHT